MIKRLSSHTLLFLTLFACAGEDPELENPKLVAEVTKLASLGRFGEAERLTRGSEDPLVKAFRAGFIRKDTVLLRNRGLTSFDRNESERLASEVLPFLKKNATTDPRCATRLGTFYRLGIGVEMDPAECFKWYLSAAQKGDPVAMQALGFCYRDGLGTEKDSKMAFEWVKRAADAGDPFALVALGECYSEGVGTPKNSALGAQCYEKAAAGGSVDAIGHCALIASEQAVKSLENQDLNSATEYMKSYESWLTKGASAGDAVSAHSLGALLRMGAASFPPADPRRSFQWYQKAADSGVSFDLADLACCYLWGWGCKKDSTRAGSLFLDALAAATREGNEDLTSKLKDVLSITDEKRRMATAAKVFDWMPPK